MATCPGGDPRRPTRSRLALRTSRGLAAPRPPPAAASQRYQSAAGVPTRARHWSPMQGLELYQKRSLAWAAHRAGSPFSGRSSGPGRSPLAHLSARLLWGAGLWAEIRRSCACASLDHDTTWRQQRPGALAIGQNSRPSAAGSSRTRAERRVPAHWDGPPRGGCPGQAVSAGAGTPLEPRLQSASAGERSPGSGGPATEPGSVENLSVVYRSSDFLVVNKHWDLRIDCKSWRETLTLQKQLRHRFPELADPDTCYGFRFCHQLDFSTSGALCVALNKAAAGGAYRCFKERRVTKAYLALVRGHVQKRLVTIDHAIGRNSTEGRTHTMCVEGTLGCENPKPSLTELLVLEHGLYAGDPVSKVLLKPLTGRTHQLRVHCSAIGHPVVGDLTYGQARGQEGRPFRMMLHAFYLRIPTHAELVEACTPDPFLPTLDACWQPHTLVQPLDQLVQALRAAPDPTDRDEESCRPSGPPPGPSQPPADTEAQRASCLQWLSEWTLEADS
ncbi:RNA pseudouridylate synthase domain-containing protein 1 [Ctenodactylus gundi]